MSQEIQENSSGPQPGTKWYKTRKCGCGECTFFSEEERPECPMVNEPTAIWLWAMNINYFQRKDYVDPLDTMTLSYSGEEQQPQETSSSE